MHIYFIHEYIYIYYICERGHNAVVGDVHEHVCSVCIHVFVIDCVYKIAKCVSEAALVNSSIDLIDLKNILIGYELTFQQLKIGKKYK